jgi:hypothetical protein
MDTVHQYYEHYIPESNINYEKTVNAGHAVVTTDAGNPCPYNGKPFINDCDYDASGFLLTHIYGHLVCLATSFARNSERLQ